jgi:large subunit ribosomal protein L5
VNVSVGKSGEPLEKASKILEQITGQKPCYRKAKQTVKDFGIRKGEPIACMVTLRGSRASEFLKKALAAVGNKISETSFDRDGNFAFGIKEHIEIPGTKYVPELGIIGMDVCTSIEKPGYRVRRKKRGRSNIGAKHAVSREEAIQFVRDLFNINIVKASGE